MNVRAFHFTDHVSIIRHWLSQRDLRRELADELPEFGFIAFERDEPIAAAFLRRVEPNHAQLDGLITNVLSTSALRHEAIDLVVKANIEKARELRIKQILAFSIDEGTLVRSEKHRFVKLPHTVIVLSLGG
jgi:hypothetical protein